MQPPHRYPPEELARVEGGPLPLWRLVAIWRSLPDRERFPFILSLDETIADAVIELTAAPAQSGREGT